VGLAKIFPGFVWGILEVNSYSKEGSLPFFSINRVGTIGTWLGRVKNFFL
jgi:hypothetical protein